MHLHFGHAKSQYTLSLLLLPTTPYPTPTLLSDDVRYQQALWWLFHLVCHRSKSPHVPAELLPPPLPQVIDPLKKPTITLKLIHVYVVTNAIYLHRFDSCTYTYPPSNLWSRRSNCYIHRFPSSFVAGWLVYPPQSITSTISCHHHLPEYLHTHGYGFSWWKWKHFA